MNVQPVTFMPTRDAPGLRSMNGSENRAEPEAFSKELERKVDESATTKGANPLKSEKIYERTPTGSQGQQSVKSESETDSSVEKSEASDSEIKSVRSESGEYRLAKKQTKEERLKKFMDSLESEFQIPPTRIVEVFSQLTPQELSLPAEQSIDRVVNKLELEGESTDKVKILYGDLIQDLATIDAKTAGMTSGGAQKNITNVAAIGLTQERFDKIKAQRNALQKSLDQMNQNFWQPQVMAQVPVLAQPNPVSKSVLSNRDRNGLESYRDISLSNAAVLNREAMGMEPDQEFIYDPRTGELFAPSDRLNPAMIRDDDFNQMLAMNEVPRNVIQGEEKSNTEQLPMAAALTSTQISKGYSREQVPYSNPDIKMEMNKIDRLNDLTANKSADLSAANLSKMSIAASGGSKSSGSDFFSHGNKNSDSKHVEVSSKKTNGDDMKSMLAASLTAGSELKDNSLTSSPIGEAPKMGSIAPEVADKNIQNVLQQAQYLVKNGGGEMKVTMTPEGLGEIQLNVELKDGRVQLQMLTDNKETKKMLEANMSELRENLSQQKITLDSVRIDSVVRTNVENQTQSGNHFGQNLNQEQGQNPRETRQFWNQFQEQFGGRPQREALFESPKAKGYAPKKSTTLAPAEVSVASRSDGKSKGLNLVA